MFGISGYEFFVLLVVLVVVIGPQRLPEYTRQLTRWVRQLRLFLDNAKTQIAEEVGPELADLNLQDLNPRNYDPRKIVRDALGEDLDAIRRDLTQPFESFGAAAKESGDAAAKELKEGTRSRHGSKSLSSMIDDKAQQAREAAEGAVAAGAAAAAATTSAGAEGTDLQEAAAHADAVTAELPQVGTEAEQDAGAPTDEQAEAAVGAGRGAGVLPGLDEERTARHRAARELADDVAFAVAPDGPVAPEHSAAPVAHEEQAPEIPSTLVDAEAPRTETVRPLSPREVVRASAAAARSSREALSAVVG